jgi:hypothetical protein
MTARLRTACSLRGRFRWRTPKPGSINRGIALGLPPKMTGGVCGGWSSPPRKLLDAELRARYLASVDVSAAHECTLEDQMTAAPAVCKPAGEAQSCDTASPVRV